MICLNPKYSKDNTKLAYRCGKCINCRILKRQQWTIRLLHEKQKWEHLYFFTMTYDDKNLPENGTLVRDDCRKFLKKLWRRGFDFKYFLVGEYGSNSKRPHYHMLYFTNEKFNFQKRFNFEGKIIDYCTKSFFFEQLWEKGIVRIDEVYDVGGLTYVTSYVEKKIITKFAKDKFYDDGRASEFQMQSKGLGSPTPENAVKDYFLLGNSKVSVPKYYKDKNRYLVEQKKIYDNKKLNTFLNFSTEAYSDALRNFNKRHSPFIKVDEKYVEKMKLERKNFKEKHGKGVL